MLKKYLGPPKFFSEVADRTNETRRRDRARHGPPAGGDIIFIESTRMNGQKGLTLTGSLGDVMKESAQAALSYIRSRADRIGIAPDFFEKSDIHVHVPAGAIPKDGPSAGVTIAASLASLLTRAAGAQRRCDDGRDHVARQGAAGRRNQGKSSGGTARRNHDGDPAAAQRERPRGYSRRKCAARWRRSSSIRLTRS